MRRHRHADIRNMAKASVSAMLDQMAGRTEGHILVRGRTGLIVRKPPQFKKVLTPSQHETTVRLRAAASLWMELTYAEVQKWRDYSSSVTKVNSINGQEYHPTAYNAFTMLTTKFLQINPALDPPRTPPTRNTNFTTPLLSITPIEDGLRIISASALPENEYVEILTQKLPSPHRQPGNQYVTTAFISFLAPPLEFDLPLEPGWYALAYRSVCSTTGEQTPTGVLGVFTVGDMGQEDAEKEAA